MRELTVLLGAGVLLALGAVVHYFFVPLTVLCASPPPLYNEPLPFDHQPRPNATSTGTSPEACTRKEYLEDYLSKKPFLSVEDGLLQLELEHMLPESDRSKVAIVTAVMGGYDAGPPLPIHQTMMDDPRVDFFFFCDEGFNYTVSPPWRIIQRDYFSMDDEVDLGTKNSISTLKADPEKLRHLWNMQSKYIAHLAWRVPELKNYRYIMYVGGGFRLSYLTSPTFYDRVTDWLSNGTLMFLSRHSDSYFVRDEVRFAMNQPRYVKDGIEAQLKHYLTNYLYDDQPGYTPWLGFMVYDSYSPEIRRLLLHLNEECQVWTLEDQVTFPVFVYWLGLRDRIRLFPNERASPFCQLFFQLPPDVPCRAPHTTSSYGQR